MPLKFDLSTLLFQYLSKMGITFFDLTSGFRPHKSLCSKGFLKPRQIMRVNQPNNVLDKYDACSSGLICVIRKLFQKYFKIHLFITTHLRNNIVVFLFISFNLQELKELSQDIIRSRTLITSIFCKHVWQDLCLINITLLCTHLNFCIRSIYIRPTVYHHKCHNQR